LIMLIVENLIQNAVQATPEGKTVKLIFGQTATQIMIEVTDEGGGFPAGLRDQLFAPCRSGKEGGAGIGLAISKQLANHLGAALELKSSSAQGCVFRLTVPSSRVASESSMLRTEVAGV